MGSDMTWVGKKPLRRIGGMSDVLSIAVDLGFSVPPPPSQEEVQNLSSSTGEKCDDLIKVLRELTAERRKIADLQVVLQGRKDRTIARLQQPYSLDCIPVEAEYQKQFSELLMKAASDYVVMPASVLISNGARTLRSVIRFGGQEMLRPIPVALASCMRFFEAMSAMRGSFATLQNLRVGHSVSSLLTTPTRDSSQGLQGDSECMTPPPRKNESRLDDLAIKNLGSQYLELQEVEDENSEVGDFHLVDGASHTLMRLSWPPWVKKNGL